MGRVIDELGRIVISQALREELDIREGDKYDFEVLSDKETGVKELVLVLCQNHCCVCGETENLTEVNEHFICPRCINAIKGI